MGEIQRWSPWAMQGYSSNCGMVTTTDGDYVLYADHCAEVERLKVEVEILQSTLPHPGDGSCVICGFAPVINAVCDECRNAPSENARLREAVRWAHNFAPLMETTDPTEVDAWRHQLLDRAGMEEEGR